MADRGNKEMTGASSPSPLHANQGVPPAKVPTNPFVSMMHGSAARAVKDTADAAAAAAAAAFSEASLTPDQKVAAKRVKAAEQAEKTLRKGGNTIKAVIDKNHAWFAGLELRSLALLTIDVAGASKLGVQIEVAAEIKPMCKAKSEKGQVVCCKLCADPAAEKKIDELTDEDKAKLKAGDVAAGKLAVELQPARTNKGQAASQAIDAAQLLGDVRAAREVLRMHGVRKMIAPSTTEAIWTHLRTKHAAVQGVQEACEAAAVAAAPVAAAPPSAVTFDECWATFKPLSAELDLFVTGLITQYFCRTTLPISHCEDPAFRALLYQIAKLYATRSMTSEQPPLPAKAQTQPALKLPQGWTSFPSRQTVADNIRNSMATVLQKTAGLLREVVTHVEGLTSVPHVLKRLFTMTGDLWKSPSGADMFALQLTTINRDFAFEARLIQFEPVLTSKTGSNLAAVVSGHAKAHGMQDLFTHVSLAVLDGASNNKTMTTELDLEFEHCYAHRLNLVAKNAVAFLTHVSSTAADRDDELETDAADLVGSGGGDDDEADAAFDEIRQEFGAVLHPPPETITTDGDPPVCFLSLAAQQDLRDMLEALFGWAATYHTSSTFKHALYKAREHLRVPEDVKKKGLVQRCATRWSASFQCLLRMSELWDSVDKVAADALKGGKHFNYKNPNAKKLRADGKELLSHLLAVMRVVDETMVALQSGFMPVGQAWLHVRGVYELLDDEMELEVRSWDINGDLTTEFKHVHELKPEALNLARLYRYYLRRYFDIAIEPEAAVLVNMALDPYCRAMLGLGWATEQDEQWCMAFIRKLTDELQKARTVRAPAKYGGDSMPTTRLTGKMSNNGRVDEPLFKHTIEPFLSVPLWPNIASLRLPAIQALWRETLRCSPSALRATTATATATTAAQAAQVAQVAPDPELLPERPPETLTAQQRMFRSAAAAHVDQPKPTASDIKLLEFEVEFKECWSFLLLPVDRNIRGAVRPVPADRHHALTWWSMHEKAFPSLALAARISFAAPSTSCMPESLFSRCKHLERDSQKGRQLPEMLAARTLLREAHAAGSRLGALELAMVGKAKRGEKRRRDTTESGEKRRRDTTESSEDSEDDIDDDQVVVLPQ